MNDIVLGAFYRNNKNGRIYFTLSFSRHTETGEDLVNYRVYCDPENPGKEISPVTWSRPVELWASRFTQMPMSDALAEYKKAKEAQP